MSSDKIDKAVYDKKRYDSLRERGISKDRAKRVGTVPMDRPANRDSAEKKTVDESKHNTRKNTSDPASVEGVSTTR